MNELIKPPTPPTPVVDGFDYDDGAGRSSGARFVKFDAGTQSLWHDRDGAAYLGPYVGVDCGVELTRWGDKKVVDRILQKPGEDLPDPDALNAEIPQSEWEEGFDGTPKGPWVKTYIVYLINPADASKVICSNSTSGHSAAFNDYKERVRNMRRLRGEHVSPIVMLSSTMMKTRFGLKKRPHFDCIDWRILDGGQPAIAPAPVISLPGSAVAPVTAAEIVNDSVDDFSAPPKKARNGRVKKVKTFSPESGRYAEGKVEKPESVAPFDDEIPNMNP